MKFYLISLLTFLGIPLITIAQNTPARSNIYHLIDRIQIKLPENDNTIFTSVKPYNEISLLEEIRKTDSLIKLHLINLSSIDEYNINKVRNSKHILQNKDANFHISVDPVLQIQGGVESFNKNSISLLSYGLTTNGNLKNKLNFSFTITNNSEKGPQFFIDRVKKYNAVPGQTNYSVNNSSGFNYVNAFGRVSFEIIKHINLEAGYDRNFIGNGYRSMFLSDFSGSYPFLKINTKIWKFNYENIFAKIEPLNFPGGIKTSRKVYMAMHHLSANLGRKLNIGLFENIVSARDGHIDFEYLNPIIFLRQAEGNVGSPDKAHVGRDAKYNAAQTLQFYGQFMLDEFLAKEFFSHSGYWANKWAFQGGTKYIDAFTIKNLDLQLEANIVRPYTYTHYDPVTNYSNNNQPLADPIGANFHELIAMAKYQPAKKWHVDGRIIYYNQGLDSAGYNLGSNIFLDYNTRARDYGFKIGGGNKAKCLNATINVGYEICDNLFVEATAMYRNYTVADNIGNNKTTYGTLGIRWNINKREYNY
ncbi:MAG: hypothetical protein NVSMB45_10430 [Ginsengibacter sp.]